MGVERGGEHVAAGEQFFVGVGCVVVAKQEPAGGDLEVEAPCRR